MENTPQLLVIEWVDSRPSAPGWQRLADAAACDWQRCISVGFLIREDARSKVIAPNLGAGEGQTDWDQASNLITIPTASITDIRHINAMQMAPPKPRPLADAQWLRRLA